MGRCGLVRVLLACVLTLALSPLAAHAQESAQAAPRFGLTIGYPSGGGGGQIGLVWEKSDRWAIRPQFTFSFSSRTITAGNVPTPTNDSWSGGISVAVLRYVAKRDSMRAYVGPTFSFGGSTTNAGAGDSTTASYGVGANTGLLYSLTRRIAVFGEVGLNYIYATNNYGGTPPQEMTTHNVTTRATLGLNLYF